jgi:hypothetical protein
MLNTHHLSIFINSIYKHDIKMKNGDKKSHQNPLNAVSSVRRTIFPTISKYQGGLPQSV